MRGHLQRINKRSEKETLIILLIIFVISVSLFFLLLFRMPVEGKQVYSTEEKVFADVEKSLKMIITAYTLHPSECGKEKWEKGYGVTYSGLRLTNEHNKKVVAADPNIFPMGTKLHIEGIGEVVVQDTGSAIKGHRLDLFWDEADRHGALQFGKQIRKVVVLE